MYIHSYFLNFLLPSSVVRPLIVVQFWLFAAPCASGSSITFSFLFFLFLFLASERMLQICLGNKPETNETQKRPQKAKVKITGGHGSQRGITTIPAVWNPETWPLRSVPCPRSTEYMPFSAHEQEFAIPMDSGGLLVHGAWLRCRSSCDGGGALHPPWQLSLHLLSTEYRGLWTRMYYRNIIIIKHTKEKKKKKVRIYSRTKLRLRF